MTVSGDADLVVGSLDPERVEVVVVVPCFNEAQRLDVRPLGDMLGDGSFGVVLVDDGSTDATWNRFGTLVDGHPGSAVAIRCSRNRGKGEAVRTGMRAALGSDPRWVAYLDADLAVAPAEFAQIVHRCAPGIDVILASRVRLLGYHIDRRLSRHLVGRVFATFASLLLALPVYDTQCGAKGFRVTPVLRAALATEFETAWLFDVELLARLMYPEHGDAVGVDALEEVPLRQWRDVAGGALGVRSAGAIARESLVLARTVSVARRRFERRRQRPG
ncbi:MAG: glycosyltransferase [Actinobacteria bacterium]|nr:glycosyltransferase [Actinomycetota bacterium]